MAVDLQTKRKKKMKNNIKWFAVVSFLLCVNFILCSSQAVSAEKPV